MDAHQASRYLALLGIPPRPPSRAALEELVGAHLARIPFENLSKLLRHARGEAPVLDPLDAYLHRCERFHLGGTCYACAVHFNALLRHLGYEARLCGAAMAEPDVHAVNVVTADGGEFLVDVGYGAPLRAPLPLDSAAPVSVSLGPERWELHPSDASGRSRLDHRRDGVVVHAYTVDPRPRRSEHFPAVIARSFRSDALFLNCLRILRHGPERSVSVRDREVTVITGGTVRATTLPSREALRDVVAVLLQIPEAVTDAALDALEERASERQ